MIHACTYRGGPLRHDPIEDAPEHAEAFEAVEDAIDRTFTTVELGDCHRIWQLEKELLFARGIQWLLPVDMNPGTKFA